MVVVVVVAAVDAVVLVGVVLVVLAVVVGTMVVVAVAVVVVVVPDGTAAEADDDVGGADAGMYAVVERVLGQKDLLSLARKLHNQHAANAMDYKIQLGKYEGNEYRPTTTTRIHGF